MDETTDGTTDERPQGWPFPNPSDDHFRSGCDAGGGHWYHREFYIPSTDKIIGYPADADIPDEAVFIGIHEHHRSTNNPELWCGGYLWFKNVDTAVMLEQQERGQARHTLVQQDPLTVEPSIGCRTCASHGFLREGRWSDA